MKNETAPLFTHPVILAAVAAAVVIAAGSGLYYFTSTQEPAAPSLPSSTSTAAVTGSGVVEAAQSGDLAFETGGRVVSVTSVGRTVARGTLLASLDTSALAAARDQASANLAAAQAKLSEMQAGPRDVDLAQKQTAVSQAQQNLSNDYAVVPNLVGSTYASAYSAMHTDTDALFNSPDSAEPGLNFTSANSQAVTDTQNGRIAANIELSTWKNETQGLGSDTASLEAALAMDIQHLYVLRAYGVSLGEAIASYVPTTGFGATQSVSAQTSIAAMQSSINALITTLQTAQQKISSDKLAVTSAQNALDQLKAGSTPQDLAAQNAAVEAAQASLEAAQAALGNAIITSPFAGVVAAVDVKTGQIVAPGTTAVSVTPSSGLELTVYFSAIDAAKLSAGQAAQVTLDAYGTARVFPASVATVDKAPSKAPDGTQGYKVTFAFDQSDSISIGMTGNVSVSTN